MFFSIKTLSLSLIIERMDERVTHTDYPGPRESEHSAYVSIGVGLDELVERLQLW